MNSTRPVMPAVSDLARLEEVCELAAPVAAASERPCRDRRERSIVDDPPDELYDNDPEAWPDDE